MCISASAVPAELVWLLVADLCSFGPALSVGSGEKEAAEQTSCSLYQADGKREREGREGVKEGAEMERMQKRGKR